MYLEHPRAAINFHILLVPLSFIAPILCCTALSPDVLDVSHYAAKSRLLSSRLTSSHRRRLLGLVVSCLG